MEWGDCGSGQGAGLHTEVSVTDFKGVLNVHAGNLDTEWDA